MISDDPTLTIFDTSGDGQSVGNVNIGGGATLGDDEDYNMYSGSGSGSHKDVDTEIETGNVGTNIDVIFPDNPSNSKSFPRNINNNKNVVKIVTFFVPFLSNFCNIFDFFCGVFFDSKLVLLLFVEMIRI